MEYRKLGKSGLRVSEIGLGTNSFGFPVSESESVSIIGTAMENGINFIDTGDIYRKGLSEEIIGKAIKGKRSQVILGTKFGAKLSEYPNDRGASRYHIIQAVEGSLKRLNTDYIDLYYLHYPDPETDIEETIRALDDLVRSGKVRYIGCSNFSAWQLCNALWVSLVKNLESFIVVQMEYNLLNRQIEQEMVPCSKNFGIGIVPHTPLAGGFLSGKYKPGKQAASGSHLDVFDKSQKRIINDINFEKLEKLQTLAAEYGHTQLELAFAWLLSHSWISSVIAGVTKIEQLSTNVSSASIKLTTQELEQLDKL